MNFGWMVWSNPVAIWWSFLVAVSITNIALWFRVLHEFRVRNAARGLIGLKAMVWLCAAYVFVCAFRSIVPRADVSRICLFDSWISSVLVGRSAATVAEVCFSIQWALVLRHLARLTKSNLIGSIWAAVAPMIILAECSSWYAVITTSYLGNTVENSIWALTFVFIVLALVRAAAEFRGLARYALIAAIFGIVGYVIFLAAIDVPMYFSRWTADMAHGKPLLGLAAGLHDLGTRWVVTRSFSDWKDEIPWMTLYFSVGVWSSLTLCLFELMKDELPRYRLSKTQRGSLTRLPIAS